MPEWLENLQYLVSSNIMKLGRMYATGSTYNVPSGRSKEPSESTALSTYLLPRQLLRKKFLEHGYIEGSPGDYGLVRRAVGENNYPVFLTFPDKVSRDLLVPIGNDRSSFLHTIPRQALLQHAGNFPSAFYIDLDFKVYRKDWDINDYGNTKGAGKTYGNNQWIANLVDKLGSPTVVTTGFLPVFNLVFDNKTPLNQYTLYDLYEDRNPMAIDFIKNRGLVPYYEDVPVSLGPEVDKVYKENGWLLPKKKKLTMFTLPEVTVTAKRKKK